MDTYLSLVGSIWTIATFFVLKKWGRAFLTYRNRQIEIKKLPKQNRKKINSYLHTYLPKSFFSLKKLRVILHTVYIFGLVLFAYSQFKAYLLAEDSSKALLISLNFVSLCPIPQIFLQFMIYREKSKLQKLLPTHDEEIDEVIIKMISKDLPIDILAIKYLIGTTIFIRICLFIYRLLVFWNMLRYFSQLLLSSPLT